MFPAKATREDSMEDAMCDVNSNSKHMTWQSRPEGRQDIMQAQAWIRELSRCKRYEFAISIAGVQEV